MNDRNLTRTAAALALALTISGHVRAQTTAAPAAGTPAPAPTATPAAAEEEDEGEMIVLTPFEVTASTEGTYTEGATLAGNRLATDLRDLGNAVSVVNTQFLKDTGATDNSSLLQYTVGTEVGNTYGNYTGTGNGAFLDESGRFTQPNQNTRVRGLAAADNARDLFLTDVPWDGAIIDRVELQRGPQATLFGMGSPAGVINSGTKQASYRNAASAEIRVGSFGTTRGVLDVNREIIQDELAVRGVLMSETEKFKQEPAFDKDERLYGAFRYEPGFLKKGSARTIIKGNIESGSIESNRPRSLPPMDLITPWFNTGTYAGNYTYSNGTWTSGRTFNELNRGTFIPSQLQDDNTGLPNHGQMRPSFNGGPQAGQPNTWYQPRLGNFAQQFGGPMVFFDYDSPALPTKFYTWEPTARRGIGSNGLIDNGVGAIPYQRPGGIARASAFAQNARLPYYDKGVYKDWTLTDSSVFDFYNNLMDGPNKEEWQNFDVYNLNLTQTFFNDKVGFEAVYTEEAYDNGQLSLLAGERQAIYIDVNSVYSDGTPTGLNGEPHADGTPNPNVGRAYLSDSGQFGNNSYKSNRETMRFTAFVTHDFAKENKSFLPRLVGKHTITGMYAEETQDTDRRSWQRYGTDYSWDRWNTNPNAAALKFTDNVLTPQTVIYLGDSLLGSSTASGAHLPRPKVKHVISSGTMRAFNSDYKWQVDPAAAWFNAYYPAGDTRGNSTQSENSANYVGWQDIPMAIYDTEAPGNNRDWLTRDARLTSYDLESKVIVWQGHLWDNALVGTFSWRNDYQEAWQTSRNTDSQALDIDNDPSTPNVAVRYPDGRLILSPDNYYLPKKPTQVPIDEDSKSWMAVVHFNQVPGLSSLMEKFPVNVSAFYNESSNFQPAALRVDVYGEPVSSPKGETTDYGILLATKDGKYSLKVNKYETIVTNASSNALGGAWFIGASQAWSGNWVNRFDKNWTSDNIGGAVAVNDPTNTQYNYGTAPGETLAQAQAREQAAITAWRNWQASVDPRFYTAWSINLNDPTRGISASTPGGFTVLEDATSTGYEVEFSAQPVKNWRITINGSKSEAVRENIGGTNLRAFMNAYDSALKTSALGDLRIWWGGAGNETSLLQWNNNIGSEWALRKLQEGTAVPELREWRWNLINTYDFSTGWLKNVSVGGAIRYQSDVVIGYEPVPTTPNASEITFNLDDPYKGPSETDFDLWIGYWRKLGDKVTWNIQLNVRNAFNGNDLIPISTQPDGTPAGYRIKPPQTWTLTNTFKF
jgi:hypothetical protein